MSLESPRPWVDEIVGRMRNLFLLKLVGTTAWIWVFFIGYFYLLHHPAYPVVQMPLTALDSFVVFRPYALYPYLSLWLYVGIAPGLQRGFNALLVYGLWAGALCVAGLSIFYFWPTQVPPMQVLAMPIVDAPGFALMQGIDAGGNACPSMHVAFAVFTAVRIEQLFREIGAPAALRWLNLAWCIAIAYSTLAVKQHVVVDVVAGAALGAAFAWASMRWSPRVVALPHGALAGRAAIMKRH